MSDYLFVANHEPNMALASFAPTSAIQLARARNTAINVASVRCRQGEMAGSNLSLCEEATIHQDGAARRAR